MILVLYFIRTHCVLRHTMSMIHNFDQLLGASLAHTNKNLPVDNDLSILYCNAACSETKVI